MPAGNLIYVVRGSLTTGHAAAWDFLSIAPATTSSRIAVLGITIGNQVATSAQAVAWALGPLQTTPSGGAFTPVPLDSGNSRAAVSKATSAISAAGTGTQTIQDEFAFDIVGSYTKWYPPGKELWVDGGAATSTIFVVRKTIGADTSTWSIATYFAE